MAVITTTCRDLAEQLTRKGFEIISVAGDDVKLPKLYYLSGNKEWLTNREKAGIDAMSRFQRGKNKYVTRKKG